MDLFDRQVKRINEFIKGDIPSMVIFHKVKVISIRRLGDEVDIKVDGSFFKTIIYSDEFFFEAIDNASRIKYIMRLGGSPYEALVDMIFGENYFKAN